MINAPATRPSRHLGCTVLVGLPLCCCLLALLLGASLGQEALELVADPCALSGDNCSECLRQPGCAWCGQQGFPRGMARCNPAALLLENGCGSEAIEDPQSRIDEVTAPSRPSRCDSARRRTTRWTSTT